MPTFKYRGKPLIYFAAAMNHLAIYGTSAGTLHFTPAEPLAPDRVEALLRERMATIDGAATARRTTKKHAD